MKSILLVGLGGGIGSILRYLTGVFFEKYSQHAFPFATFTVNFVGCLIIGALIGLIDRQHITNPDFKFLLITGFCGGFTTFSAFSAETLNLFNSGYTFLAFTYIIASVVLGLLAVWAGLSLVKIA
ncbi:MAG: fluoride efflux transporter CrcB [Bacteroidales bacterium]|nr:fluoride efflux transporter CrcB [Bacteroidales bacterium]